MIKFFLIFITLISCEKKQKPEVLNNIVIKNDLITICIDNSEKSIIEVLDSLSKQYTFHKQLKIIEKNTIKNPLLFFDIDILNESKFICKEIVLEKDKTEIFFWVFQFKNAEKSCLLNNYLFDLSNTTEMKKTVLIKNFIGYKRYNESIILLKREYYDSSFKDKFSKIFELVTPIW